MFPGFSTVPASEIGPPLALPPPACSTPGEGWRWTVRDRRPSQPRPAPARCWRVGQHGIPVQRHNPLTTGVYFRPSQGGGVR
jgi:hypothetical protein